jgi:dTDP-4-dehydrorhamnose 3,5-epimerase
MQITSTNIKDCFIIQPAVFADSRGYFFESFNAQKFKESIGLDINFVQDNESMSNANVVRGLHGQKGEHAQAKLVRVVQGAVNDVVVDVRPDSPSYLQHIVVQLSAENKTSLFLPTGCVHGFAVLQDNTIFQYKCSALYNKASEIGVHPYDESLNINWGINTDVALLSDKDILLPKLKDIAHGALV